jgi:hypothetical protein
LIHQEELIHVHPIPSIMPTVGGNAVERLISPLKTRNRNAQFDLDQSFCLDA